MTREILTVAQLNRAVAGLLERSLPLVWVSGELSNVTRAASGHWYFTLKEAGAQVRAVMFRGRAQYVDFAPREGDRVEVRALVTLYEPRGDFQLNVEAMRRAGAGDLHQRFLQLKARLQDEGLFDSARKRVLPRMPRAIGVITSPQAAALRDVLSTLRRRAPQIPVVLYPAPVQGAEAAQALRAALGRAIARAECDVLLMVRGGGSIEDLWSFNDEALARAVAASSIPVISGVGHETDFTIVDFVADLRAPTPTAAAELVAPDRRELLAAVDELCARLEASGRRRLARAEQQLDLALRLLRPPSAQWRERAQRLQWLLSRLQAGGGAQQARRHALLERVAARLRAPSAETAGLRLQAVSAALARAGRVAVEARALRVRAAASALDWGSPQAVLERGYAIVSDAQGRVLARDRLPSPGEAVRVRLARVEFDAVAGPGRPTDAD